MFYAKAILVILFIFVLAKEINKQKRDHTLLLFLILCGIYIFGKVVLEIVFDYGSLRKINFFVDYTLSDQTEYRVLTSLYIFLTAVIFSGHLPNLRFSWRLPTIKIIKNGNTVMLIITGLIFAYYISTRLLFVLNFGYNEYQNGGFGTKPILIFVCEQIFWLLIFQKLQKSNSHTKRRILLYLIISILTLDMLTGKRGTAAIQLVIVIYIMNNLGLIKISLLKSLILAIGFIFILDFIGEVRHSAQRGFESYSFKDAGLVFFDEQASSLNTLAYAVEYSETSAISSYNLRSFFADIFILWEKIYVKLGLSKATTLEEKAKKFGYSGYILTNEADPYLLSQGKSIGTSFITELWLLGREFLVFFGSIILCVFLRSVDIKRYDMLAVNLILVPDLVYLARMSFGSVIVLNVFAILLLLINGLRIRLR
ncbi:MAG: hypothetical protein CMC19_05325 [Flavobacteriaceae bacterium]|nr:hypothetical protein [Flavobacteriaceae bacterium]